MQYFETVKEKKYKPLFGYGYEPQTSVKKERIKNQNGPQYDMFGNMKEGEVSPEEESGFEKPEGSPLMGVVIALTLVVALFLIAVIMSLKNEPDTVRIPGTVRYVISCMESGGTEYLSDGYLS